MVDHAKFDAFVDALAAFKTAQLSGSDVEQARTAYLARHKEWKDELKRQETIEARMQSIGSF